MTDLALPDEAGSAAREAVCPTLPALEAAPRCCGDKPKEPEAPSAPVAEDQHTSAAAAALSDLTGVVPYPVVDTDDDYDLNFDNDAMREMALSDADRGPSGAPHSPRQHRTNLYVSNLSTEIDDAALYVIFSGFGGVVNSRVMVDIHSGRSRGFAFVQFTTDDSAREACATLHGRVIRGRTLTVRPASRRTRQPGYPTTKVFVRNLPSSVAESEIRELFARYGRVTGCAVRTDHQHGLVTPMAQGVSQVAYVTMADVHAAAAAGRDINNSLPFPQCTAPLLAKVVDTNQRNYRFPDRDDPTGDDPLEQALLGLGAQCPPDAMEAPPAGPPAAPYPGTAYHSGRPSGTFYQQPPTVGVHHRPQGQPGWHHAYYSHSVEPDADCQSEKWLPAPAGAEYSAAYSKPQPHEGHYWETHPPASGWVGRECPLPSRLDPQAAEFCGVREFGMGRGTKDWWGRADRPLPLPPDDTGTKDWWVRKDDTAEVLAMRAEAKANAAEAVAAVEWEIALSDCLRGP